MNLVRPRRLAAWLGAVAVWCGVCTHADASVVSLGALSYDTFIAASGGSPGVDAFDLANLTGNFGLPPDFPVVDNLIFLSASLKLNPIGQTTELFTLGDVAPGFLLDSSGNPVVQALSTQAFASAEFTATLSSQTFALGDGTTFAAGSPLIDILLLPSQGSSLTVDVDQTAIDVSSAVPEPKSWGMTVLVLPWFFRRRLPQ
jgi:hypothetical protein